jgi:hypothetical protein
VTDWFTGNILVVRYDAARDSITFIAKNGKAPPLTFVPSTIVSVTAIGNKLELVGAFDGDTKIALKLPHAAEVQDIANALATNLQLPRQPLAIAPEQAAATTDGTYVTMEGRCFPYADGPVMGPVGLDGVAFRVEPNAPYRATGFLRSGERPRLRVIAIEHMNPPVVWFTGETVRVYFAPERNLLIITAQPGNTFHEPPGTYELLVDPDTLVSVAIDGDALVFEGDMSRTSMGNRVRLAPISPSDQRAIFLLLDERCQLPRTPRLISVAEAHALRELEYVSIEGTYQDGHYDSPNFEGIHIRPREGFTNGQRYRVTGFLAPPFRPDGPFLGPTGTRMNVLARELLRMNVLARELLR